MAAGIIDKSAELFEDLGYKTRKSIMHIIGKAGIKGAAELAVGAGSGAAGLSWAVVGVAAPVAAAFSASIVQSDHLHRREGFLNQYREHIASWLNKQTGETRKPEEMKDADLELAAFGDKKRGIKGNPVLQESLEQSAKARNWGVAISAISTIISTVVVGGLLHAPLEGMGLPIRALIGGAVGFGLYLPITMGIHWVAENMFGLEKVTINDRIKEMDRERARGKSVSEEQVLEAFLQAHSEVAAMVKAGFGKRFSKLDKEQKQQVADIVGPQIGLTAITQDINQGRMRPEELAFTLYEQSSGVQLHSIVKPHEHMHLLSQTWGKVASFFTRRHKPASGAAAESAPEHVAVAMQSADGREQAAAEAYREEKPDRKVSFVQMVGRKKSDNGSRSFTQMIGRQEAYQAPGSYTEVVEQSRASTEVQVT